MEKEYVVPQGMLMAAAVAYNATTAEHGYKYVIDRMVIEPTLLAAIQWLAENPIVPDKETANKLIECSRIHSEADPFAEWQRLMFLKPNPKYPRELLDIQAWVKSNYPNDPRNPDLLESFLRVFQRGRDSRG